MYGFYLNIETCVICLVELEENRRSFEKESLGRQRRGRRNKKPVGVVTDGNDDSLITRLVEIRTAFLRVF